MLSGASSHIPQQLQDTCRLVGEFATCWPEKKDRKRRGHHDSLFCHGYGSCYFLNVKRKKDEGFTFRMRRRTRRIAWKVQKTRLQAVQGVNQPRCIGDSKTVNSDGLKPKGDGVQPEGDGLQPKSQTHLERRQIIVVTRIGWRMRDSWC